MDKDVLVEGNVMIKIKGTTFRCECGANVLSKYLCSKYGFFYKCNGCKTEYQGDGDASKN